MSVANGQRIAELMAEVERLQEMLTGARLVQQGLGAEVERLRFRAENCEESTQASVVKRLEAEVERLRMHHAAAMDENVRVEDALRAEVERLREDNDKFDKKNEWLTDLNESLAVDLARQKADNVALYEENQTLQWAAAEVEVLKRRVSDLRVHYDNDGAEIKRLRRIGEAARKVLADYDDSYGPYVHDAMEALRLALEGERSDLSG